MFLIDNLANMLKDIFGYNLKAFQRYDKATKLMSTIIETSKKLHKSMEKKNNGQILMKIKLT